MRSVTILTNVILFLYYDEMCQNLDYLHNSVTQYFPGQWIQNHTWLTGPIRVQDRCRRVRGVVQEEHYREALRNYHLFTFGVVSKKTSHDYPKV